MCYVPIDSQVVFCKFVNLLLLRDNCNLSTNNVLSYKIPIFKQNQNIPLKYLFMCIFTHDSKVEQLSKPYNLSAKTHQFLMSNILISEQRKLFTKLGCFFYTHIMILRKLCDNKLFTFFLTSWNCISHWILLWKCPVNLQIYG